MHLAFRLLYAVALLVSASACATTASSESTRPAIVPAATLRVDGSAGVMPLVAALGRAYRETAPAVTIQMGAGLGTAARVDALVQNRIDIALASHGVVRSEMAARGITVHEIARVAVVFAVDERVRITGLSSAQICDIYAGRTRNWSQLGGPDLTIRARTRPAAEVDADVVLSGVACFRGALDTTVAALIERPEAMAAELASTSGAIGMTSMPFVQASGGRLRALAVDGVSPVPDRIRAGDYRLTRASYLLTRTPVPPAVAQLLGFIRSPAGQRVIAANGGVPVE